MKKKRAFTPVETLMSAGIFGMLMVMGISIAALVTWLLFTGQTESVNRSDLSETVYYITREIQSAEAVKISGSGKVIEIKERGSSGYNLKYSLVEHYPVDYLAFKDKRLLDIDADNSRIYAENGTIKIRLCIVKNNVETQQQGKLIEINVKPRCEFYEEAESG